MQHGPLSAILAWNFAVKGLLQSFDTLLCLHHHDYPNTLRVNLLPVQAARVDAQATVLCGLQVIVWLASAVLSVLIVASRKHYSVDVLIAWYVVPLVFWTLQRRWTTKRNVNDGAVLGEDVYLGDAGPPVELQVGHLALALGFAFPPWTGLGASCGPEAFQGGGLHPEQTSSSLVAVVYSCTSISRPSFMQFRGCTCVVYIFERIDFPGSLNK